jgi:hypothetical protein
MHRVLPSCEGDSDQRPVWCRLNQCIVRTGTLPTVQDLRSLLPSYRWLLEQLSYEEQNLAIGLIDTRHSILEGYQREVQVRMTWRVRWGVCGRLEVVINRYP